jgi:hypothetical protein
MVTPAQNSSLENLDSTSPPQKAKPETTDTITIRISKLKKSQLKEECEARGIEVSTWIRALIEDTPMPKPKRNPTRQGEPELIMALNQIQTVLNQLARQVSRNLGAERAHAPASDLLCQALVEMRQIRQSLYQISLQCKAEPEEP